MLKTHMLKKWRSSQSKSRLKTKLNGGLTGVKNKSHILVALFVLNAPNRFKMRFVTLYVDAINCAPTAYLKSC